MLNSNELKLKIAEAKVKISELDVAISKIRGVPSNLHLAEEHEPVDGQPFIYVFKDPIDGEAGIKIPAGETGFFSGMIKVDGDSTFVASDIQGVQQVFWTDPNASAFDRDPLPGTYWAPLSKSDAGGRYIVGGVNFGVESITKSWGVDFGFRITDGGTGRHLDQVMDFHGNPNNAEVYIPARFMGSGMPYTDLGANYTNPLDFDHIFAKNTALRLDLNVYSPFPDDVRIWCGLIGYKVYGD